MILIGGKTLSGCQNNHHKHDDNCVTDILYAILEAQRKAQHHDSCASSCNESINDLLGKKRKSKNNTIPFLLYCDCKPFKGTGVTTYSCHSKTKKLSCVESFVFR